MKIKNKKIIFIIIIILITICIGTIFLYTQIKKNIKTSKIVDLNQKVTQLLYTQAENYNEALDIYRQIVELNKTSPTPYLNMSSIYIARKDYNSALTEIENAIKVKPNSAEAWILHGMLNDFIGNNIEAETSYTKSIEIYDQRISDPEKKHQEIEANEINKAIVLMMKDEQNAQKIFLELKSKYPNNFIIDEMLNISKEDFLKKLFELQDN